LLLDALKAIRRFRDIMRKKQSLHYW